MKKLYFIGMIALSTNLMQAEITYDEYKKLSMVAQSRRTTEQKVDYKQNKVNKNIKMETPEFRFALKLFEYYEKTLNQEMTPIEFINEVSRKVANYIEVNKDKASSETGRNEIKDFLNTYLNLSLSELRSQVGTKEEEEGIMNRYVN